MPRHVTDEYAELVHYTTAGGLSGIVTSGCFWATHAAFLNDAEELIHFFDSRLMVLAREAIASIAVEIPSTPEMDEQLAAHGGIEELIRSDAMRVTNLLKSATLGFNESFIFSMSGPRGEKVAGSGLLSQWRGYGSDGGYAIVLDSHGFDHLLKLEGQTHHYQFAQWGDVYYYGAEIEAQPSSEEVNEYENIVRKGVIGLVRGKDPASIDGLYDAITSLSCLYKHWGFAEEQEVRVIAIPVRGEVEKLASDGGEARRPRPIKSFLRNGIPVPYIELMAGLAADGERTKLPIERVIVGPHKDKSSRAKAVRHLLVANGYEVEVVCSEIPYIGR